MDALFGVLSLLTPFERGIYEDYVANFWCTTSVLVKWKRLFTTQSLKLLSLSATITTFLPSMVQQIKAPSKQGFLYGLLNSAFSFYLFSFQVHEKSILLPLLPATLLAVEEPFLLKLMALYALHGRDGITRSTLIRLLSLDNVRVGYWPMVLFTHLASRANLVGYGGMTKASSSGVLPKSLSL
ncbi:hypothetical protein FNV43_RR10365 [Rhamnella rubrinervis]|uniref:Alpha-1,3-glucosyltransferase n=1 Tax=Rhamnella rubrinervis TaxID=2594499 RepID=A0A8K0HCH8_9ROSA|nr:hypothetical protein FNV43_RR10365 [Rhamnella rubrinervis]